MRHIVGVLGEALPGNRVDRPKPGRSPVITRKPLSRQGARSARITHRLPGTPGNRSNATPPTGPTSVQAIQRPSLNSNERSVTSWSSTPTACTRRCGHHNAEQRNYSPYTIGEEEERITARDHQPRGPIASRIVAVIAPASRLTVLRGFHRRCQWALSDARDSSGCSRRACHVDFNDSLRDVEAPPHQIDVRRAQTGHLRPARSAVREHEDDQPMVAGRVGEV